MFETSVIEIDASALRANLRFLSAQIGPKPILCSVVKGNAYGHGFPEFIPLAESMGVRWFATANANEATRVLSFLKAPTSHVMIMGDVPDEALEWAIRRGVAFWMTDRGRLERTLAAATRLDMPARVHLELETGLHRTGLDAGELASVAACLHEAGERVVVEGTCTHFAGAESIANHHRIQQQRRRFDDLCAQLRALGVDLGLRHTACSAAALTEPGTTLDLVRFGIAQYGYWPSREVRMHYLTRTGRHGQRALQRLLTWKSRVMTVTEVPAGEFVGYGTTCLAERRTRVAVVPVGYADGYSRSLSNLGHVLIRGRRASVIGLVNMSALMVDVTRMKSVCAGDEVVLVGRQGTLSISVGSFSELARMVDYETLVRLPVHIPRVVTPGSATDKASAETSS